MPFTVPPEAAAGLAALFLDAPRVLQQLVSYDDVNYLVEGTAPLPGGAAGPGGGCAQQALLKVHNADEPVDAAALEAQNAAMQHVAAAGIATPTPLLARAGQAILQVPLAAAPWAAPRPPAVRMLAFLPGRVMGGAPQAPQLQVSWGELMGRVSGALASFSGQPAAAPLAAAHAWSPMCMAATIEARAPLVEAFRPEQRQRLLAAAQALRAATEQGQDLPCQVCHADGNEANILVNEERTRATAILDWGDACVCWRAAEAAIAMLYAALLPQLPGADGLDAAGHVLVGFQAACPLRAAEVATLPALVRSRLALSLTNGAYSAQLHPGNSGYLLQTQEPGWRLLARLQALPDEDLLRRWAALQQPALAV